MRQKISSKILTRKFMKPYTILKYNEQHWAGGGDPTAIL
jgi:hypothetical protein